MLHKFTNGRYHINQSGLICHGTFFDNVKFILENGLPVSHHERRHLGSNDINVTMIGSLIYNPLGSTSVANFELDHGNGVVFLGDPANMHIPKEYQRNYSDERVAYALFEVPNEEEISLYGDGGFPVTVNGERLKSGSLSERNMHMTGMIIKSPDIPREWLKGLVIPPNCFIKFPLKSLASYEHQLHIQTQRTLRFLDQSDARINRISEGTIEALLMPEEVLTEKLLEIMNGIDEGNHVPLYDVNGECLYNPFV